MLNYQAGGMLPRDTSGLGNSKWRVSFVQSEADWRMVHFKNAADAATRELTPEEQQEMTSFVNQSIAERRLLGAVQTCGCPQYLLAPALIVVSLMRVKRNRRTGLVGSAVGAVAFVLMIYRSYFASLGF